MSDQTFDEVVELALSMTPIEKVRLLERLAATLEDDLAAAQSSRPKRSLLGLWAKYGAAPSDEEIDEVRREMWRNFPREDI